MLTGLFITLEGGEGSGKSTQVRYLRGRLKRSNIPATVVREPGSTSLGDWLRQLLKFLPVPLTPEAELLLFNASRAQLVADVIRPALEKGEVVICDRFADSTLAYQGYGRGIPLEQVEAVNRAATVGLKPDLTILLDLSPEEGMRRQQTAFDRFEKNRQEKIVVSGQGYLFGPTSGEGSQREPRTSAYFERAVEPVDVMAFHQRVHQGYLELARKEPERWLTLDARLSPREVSRRIWQRVEPLLEKPGLAQKGP